MAKLEYRSVVLEEDAGLMGSLREFWTGRRRYALWLRKLRGKSGCYVIRETDSGRIWYVGESHTGALYQTITRHFQRWRSETNHTYDRFACEVAVVLTKPERAFTVQNRLICELGPRDNNAGTENCADHVPF